MAKTRRAYEGAGASTTLNGAFAAGATSFSVAAATGWPYGANPFFIVVEPGTANEEKILVTRANSGDLTLSVSGSRGADGTTDVTHADGSTVYPVFTATDADEANELSSTWTTKGDIVTHGASTFERLAVGTDGYVLTADSAASGGLAWAQVDTAQIATNAVTADKIAADSVTGSELASNSVAATHIVDGSVDTAELAADAVTTAKIADDAVTNAKIAAGAVDTTELATDAVTDAKIADNAVGAAQIAAGAVGSDEIGTGAVGTSKIADNAVTYAKLENAAGHTVLARVGGTAGDLSEIVAGANSVLRRDGTGNLAFGTIDGGHIANNSIDSGHYVDGSIDREHLAADIVNGDKIDDNSINSEHYVDGSIDNAHIADSTITSAKVDTSSILVTGSTDQSKSGKLTLTENAIGADYSTCQLVVNPGGGAGIALRTSNSATSTVQLRAGSTGGSWAALNVTGPTGSGAGLAYADIYVHDVYYSGSLSSISSETVKHDIVTLDDGALDLVNMLRSVTFRYNDDPDRQRIGFIAEEVDAAIPLAVTDHDGVPGIDPVAILSSAVAAIQELSAKVDSLQARIAELEG